MSNTERSVEEIVKEFAERNDCIVCYGRQEKPLKRLREILQAERQKAVATLEEVLESEYQKRNPPNQDNMLRNYAFDIMKSFNEKMFL